MIPCKNNSRTIGRVLDSIKGIATQLVVVDSGSTDDTMDLINACKDWSGDDQCEVVLIQTPWRGYVKTKQIALDACTHEFTLWIDSDEPLTHELRDGLRSAMAQGIDAGKVNRVVEYKGKLLKHCWQPEHRLRFVRTQLAKDNKARFAGITHDYLEVDAPIAPALISGTLIHDSFETFAKHLESQRHYSYIFANALHQQGKRSSAWKIMTSPPSAFLKQIILKGAWRDGYAGWLCAGTTAAGALMKHMMLYELQQKSLTNESRSVNTQSLKPNPAQSSGRTLFDERLGAFTHAPQMREFVGQVQIGDQLIQLVIASDGFVLNDIARDTAVRVIDNLSTLIQDAKLFASNEYLEFWNTQISQNTDFERTSEDFMNEIVLLSTTINAQGGITLEFECHDVAPGHGLIVYISQEFQIEECFIDG